MFLRRRAVLQHRVAAVCKRPEQPYRQLFEMPTVLFQKDGQVDYRTAGAAKLDGDRQAEPSGLGERLVGFARRPRLVVAARGVVRWADMIEQFLRVRAQRLLVLREGKVHGRSPRS